MEEKELRNGYTTGSCAAAGVKAALMFLLYHISLQEVEIETPKGEELVIPITKVRRRGKFASAVVQKYAGDDLMLPMEFLSKSKSFKEIEREELAKKNVFYTEAELDSLPKRTTSPCGKIGNQSGTSKK
ncbi:cobalt-precorrin-6A synthase [Fusobacterium necrophorum subsp. necrophorum]|nr:cobalt-precorrin-6A synthase [Fusobacterium necrophorum subsp. necrophorum]